MVDWDQWRLGAGYLVARNTEGNEVKLLFVFLLEPREARRIFILLSPVPLFLPFFILPGPFLAPPALLAWRLGVGRVRLPRGVRRQELRPEHALLEVAGIRSSEHKSLLIIWMW